MRENWYAVEVPPGVPIDDSNRFEALGHDCLIHTYGESVSIHSPHPLIAGITARISSSVTVQPLLNTLLRQLFAALLFEATRHLPRQTVAVKTPMADVVGPRGVWVGDIVRPTQQMVVVDIARGGTVPAYAVYEMLTAVMEPSSVRLDSHGMARTMDANEHVTGVAQLGSKIGGSIQDAVVIIPECMVASAVTIDEMLAEVYRADKYGKPLMVILLAMVITPEAIRRLTSKHPHLLIHAARLDRGMSDADALRHMPGMKMAGQIEAGINRLRPVLCGMRTSARTCSSPRCRGKQ